MGGLYSRAFFTPQRFLVRYRVHPGSATHLTQNGVRRLWGLPYSQTIFSKVEVILFKTYNRGRNGTAIRNCKPEKDLRTQQLRLPFLRECVIMEVRIMIF